MTTVDGTDEPITAVEPATRHESLEHWLRDLRADLSNDPPGWLHTDGISDAGISDAPSQPSAPPAVDDENRPAAAQTAAGTARTISPAGWAPTGWPKVRGDRRAGHLRGVPDNPGDPAAAGVADLRPSIRRPPHKHVADATAVRK